MRALLLLLIPALATAAPAPYDKSGIADWSKPPTAAAEPTFVPPVAKRIKLANGMAVLVIENHKLPIAAMELVVPNAGAAQDPSGKAGLAAFTADMLDEGAGGLTALALAQEQDRLGASIRVGADVDDASIRVSALAKNLDATLALFGKIAMQPAFDARELERVKGDRTTSLAQRSDRPREVAQIVTAAAIYGAGTAYGHATSGERADVASITAEDVERFYQAHWNPAAMTLVVAGDVDPAHLRTVLDASFGTWKPSTAKAAKIVATPAKLAHRLLLVDRPDAKQSDVRLGMPGLGRRDSRYYAFEVMSTTMGGGFTSRLNQRLREQLGITYGIGAGMSWRVEGGTFGIQSAIVTKETGHGIAEILKIADDLTATDVPAAELEKSKQNLIRALPASFETNAGIASEFAELALYGLSDDWYARYADNVRKVTARDVRMAAKLVPSGKLVVTVVGDMKVVRADLDKLGLGEPASYDGGGLPLTPLK
jgi:predicted Zn-dependent peptidase